MNLQDTKRPYDLIVSLGSSCAPAIHLRRYSLRRFSMPLDWVVSFSLSDVSRLLKNRFQGFMELKNMCLLDETHFFLDDGVPVYPDNGGPQPLKSYFVKDIHYNIISVHDFPVLPDQDWFTTYPSYKERLNKRINKFLDEIKNSQSILFVRWAASYDQAVELQSVLYTITNSDFKILILLPVDDLQDVVEVDWGIDKVCSVQVPNRLADNFIWDYILDGITLTN